MKRAPHFNSQERNIICVCGQIYCIFLFGITLGVGERKRERKRVIEDDRVFQIQCQIQSVMLLFIA